MSKDVTVAFRTEPDLPNDQMDKHEQELRRLFACGTIREARAYADNHGALIVLSRMKRRNGTAFSELADAAFRYPMISAELRDMVKDAKVPDECAASRVHALFALAGQKGDLALQRLIAETMSAWVKKRQGSREKFVADDFFRVLAERDRNAAECAEKRRRAWVERRPMSLTEEVRAYLSHPKRSVPDFINWMGTQPPDNYELIIDLLRKSALLRHGCAERAREILWHLMPYNQ